MMEPEAPPEIEAPEIQAPGSAFRWLVGSVFAVAILYLGREILIPLAVASLLTVILSPVASLLEQYIGRALGAFSVLVMTIAVLGGGIYFFAIEAGQVATEVSTYSEQIGKKISDLEKGASPVVLQVEEFIDDVNREISRFLPGREQQGNQPPAIQQLSAAPSIGEWLRPAVPFFLVLAETLLTCVLMFFLMYDRKGLRERFVRLAARGRVVLSSEAIDSATTAVGRYLFLFTIINFTYGLLIGIAMWMLGMPKPGLWGALGFVMRYLPYVGALTSAGLPAAVSFAIFPGWARTFEVVAIFVILDQISAQVAEPFIIGPGLGLAPISVLLSALFWGFIWGPVGLILATPITVCLKVAGDHIPSLRYLSILLSSESEREEYHDYYRKLLEQDREGARQLAVRHTDKEGLEKTYQSLLSPALLLTRQELANGNISDANAHFIFEAIRELIPEIGELYTKPRSAPRLKILGICPPGDRDCLFLRMLLELLRLDGFAGAVAELRDSSDGIPDVISHYTPDLVLASTSDSRSTASALDIVRRLRAADSTVPIIAGGEGAFARVHDFQEAGCAQVVPSFVSAHHSISRFAGRHARALKASHRDAASAENVHRAENA